MIVVIQCAATKRPNAGHMLDAKGRRVVFVAHPEIMPSTDTLAYAHPDDVSDDGASWRDRVTAYNSHPADNAFGLSQAIDLYVHPAYRELVDLFGIERTFILSAGWGLIRSDFLTPNYDVTFSQAADSHKRRRSADRFLDFRHISQPTNERIVFFGGKDYLRLFSELTIGCDDRAAYINSKTPPDVSGVELIPYRTATRTNWHYSCVKDFVSGRIGASRDIAPVPG
jgi:hypothetical protein